MKKAGILSTIVFFTITMFLGCEIKNKQQPSASSELIEPIVYDSSCDSIAQCEFVNYIDEKNDTTINGVKYAYCLKLSNKYILTFREYSREYEMLKNMGIVTNDSKTEPNKDNDDDIYYTDLLPSPDNKFICVSQYYETLDIKDETNVIVRFGSGWILDIEKGEFIESLNAAEVGGIWTYCNRYIDSSSGEILFDPMLN